MATRGLPVLGSSGVTGRRLSSLPRTPVAGPVADTPEGTAALIRAAVERTPSETQLQLKLLEPRLDGLEPRVVGHPWRLTYVLELPERPEDLRFGTSRNHSSIKRAVAKAHRSGVRVRPASTLKELRAWYRLYLDTMRHHVVPPRPLRLFRAIWEEMRPHGTMRLLLAERGGELLGGCLMLQLGSTVFYGFNGVRRDAFEHRPNDAIHWDAIQSASFPPPPTPPPLFPVGVVERALYGVPVDRVVWTMLKGSRRHAVESVEDRRAQLEHMAPPSSSPPRSARSSRLVLRRISPRIARTAAAVAGDDWCRMVSRYEPVPGAKLLEGARGPHPHAAAMRLGDGA
jgi:hypothetical protein